MIGKGDRIGDLYILDLHQLSTEFTSHINKVSVQLWHQRFGHPSFKVLNSLHPRLVFDFPKHAPSTPCYICPLAKQKRLSFVANNRLSPHPFDLIHCDVWGPLHEVSYSGHRYFLTLVDDCTRFTWVFLLKSKSDVTHVVPRFFNMIDTQFQCKIKCFRSDNAKELAFSDFFQSKGRLTSILLC